ncbi:MAG: hypothetical protein ACRCZ9_10155 [Fusobacteriaceae bacterium]
MYTNININEGVDRVIKLLIKHGLKPKSIGLIGELLKWVLQNNYFTYDRKTYRQVKGLQWVLCCPSFCKFIPCLVEIEMFAIIKKPLLYKRYLDDILVFVETEAESITLFKHMQNMSLSLSFSYVKCITYINFLDLKIELDGFFNRGHVTYSSFQKQQTNHLYLHPDSLVKPSVKFGWCTGEKFRLLRISKSKKKFKSALNALKEELLTTGYTLSVINKYVKYNYSNRHLVYNKLNSKDIKNCYFIVCEADNNSEFLHKFTSENRKFYEIDFILVEKNYSKVFDNLNQTSLKVITENFEHIY